MTEVHTHCPIDPWTLSQAWRAKDPSAWWDWDTARYAETMRSLKYPSDAFERASRKGNATFMRGHR